MPAWSELQRIELLHNSLADWLLAALAFLLTFTVLPLARRYLEAQRRRQAHRQMPAALGLLAHLAAHTSRVVLWIVALYAAGRILRLPSRIDRVFDIAIVVGFWLQVGLWAMAAVRYGVQRRREHDEQLRLAGSLNILLFVARLLVWGVVALLALSNLGVNITALVAGLGVGGIALALAVQTVLGDLFASLSITFDQPFVVGDFLIVDDIMGSVEYIGVKSTRLRSLSGEQIVVANADLLKSRVRNYGRMQERRVVFTLNVTYDTPLQLLQRIPKLIEEIIRAQEGTRFDRSHFSQHGAASLDFETVYYVRSADYNRYMDLQQAINLAIHEKFGQLGIEFAYPTQTLYLERARQPALREEPDAA